MEVAMNDELREAIEWVRAELRQYEGHPDLIPEPGKLVLAAARSWLNLLDDERDWPIVTQMRKAMIGQLEKHRETRGLGGWWNEEVRWLIDRLYEEVKELAVDPSWEEAADVANFAAMIVDVAAVRDRGTG